MTYFRLHYLCEHFMSGVMSLKTVWWMSWRTQVRTLQQFQGRFIQSSFCYFRKRSSWFLSFNHHPSLESAKSPEPDPETTSPLRRDSRRESMDSLSGMPTNDCTTIQCRNVPPALNKKDTIQKHFSRFGKISNVYCRPGRNLAIVHFEDHVS